MKKLTIWDEMNRMQEQMDNMFANFFGADPFFNNKKLLSSSKNNQLINSNLRQPLCDIYETDSEVIAEVEIPGIEKEDIKVHVSNEGIEIKAEVKNEKKQDNQQGTYRFERNYTGFYRHFSLPKNVDAAKASAKYNNGVLKINIPKTKKESQEKKLLEIQ